MKFADWVPEQRDFYAWVDADGMVHDVGDAFNHAEFFKDHAEFGADYQEMLAELERNEEERDQHIFNLEPDEHPGMHVFAFDDDNSRFRFYLKVYDRGWCRLGAHHWRHSQKSKWAIDLYGREASLNKHKPILLELKRYLAAKVIVGEVRDAREYYSVFDMKMRKV